MMLVYKSDDELVELPKDQWTEEDKARSKEAVKSKTNMKMHGIHDVRYYKADGTIEVGKAHYEEMKPRSA